ncbi:MAG: molybdopterin molybdotransferase MoeA [Steroidobacteraceae bacterium]
MTQRASPPITPQMAEEAIASALASLPAESLALALCIGRTLREDVYAERDNPPFDRVCMDGIAIDSAVFARGARRYVVQATQPAGVPALDLAGAEHAIEVMTGAILPRGADCVIPMEEYDLSSGAVTLKAQVAAGRYRNVQRRGEDSRPGVPMLKAGTKLGAPEIGVVASAGLPCVLVSRQPDCMAISTGDELIEPGEPIAEHQVRRSNAYVIAAALRAHGLERVSNDHLRDDERMLSDGLARHLAARDVLILSGGISKGKFDLVPQVLKSLGVREVFHYVAQQPGRPMWFGVGPRGQAVFGLPGNPVATLVCLMRYVVPAIESAMGTARPQPQRIALAAPVEFGRVTTRFLPVRTRSDALGRLSAVPHRPNGPGDFLMLTGTDGFVELPPLEEYPAGVSGNLYRW